MMLRDRRSGMAGFGDPLHGPLESSDLDHPESSRTGSKVEIGSKKNIDYFFYRNRNHDETEQ